MCICMYQEPEEGIPTFQILVNVEDAVYWICMAWYLFEQIYHVSNGVIRWYFVVGIIVGAAVFYTVEKRIRNRVNRYVKKRKRIP